VDLVGATRDDVRERCATADAPKQVGFTLDFARIP
jgi:hypothetical protein